MVGICEQESSRTTNQDQENQETTETLSKNQSLVQENEETEEIWARMSKDNNFTKNNRSKTLLRSSKSTVVKEKKQVLLEGYVGDDNEDDDLRRSKSLADDDLDELKGCLDLGFGFSYDEIPQLCSTLPALELCYSLSQKHNNEKALERSDTSSAVSQSASSSSIANWNISSPGDHPEDVKARLKFWAQAVACTVRLCS